MVIRATPNLPSRDLEATWAFYERLGFAQEYQDTGWLILARDGVTLEFFPFTDLDPATRACLPNVSGGGCDRWRMSRLAVLSDAQWELIEPLMPSSDGKRGNRFRDHRMVVEGVVYRYRTGIAWRALPVQFGPWQTVWKRHRRFSGDGTWDRIHTALLARADDVGEIDWNVSVDSTINRAHQHGTNLTRVTGGPVESQESARRAS